MAANATPSNGRRGSGEAGTRYRRKRLFSLSGVIPAGAFLIEHLVVTGSAMGGAARFDRVMGALARTQALLVFEILLVYLPLAFHALYGLHLTAKPRDALHTYANDTLYRLQRISGIVVLAFIGWHFWQIRMQRFAFGLGASDLHTRLVERFSQTYSGIPWFAVVMLIGVVATVFHLVNGLWAFRAQNERPNRGLSRLFVIFGAILGLIGTGTVVSIATGARYLPSVEPEMPACGPEPTVQPSATSTASSQEAGKTP